ncbi:MAG: hypothetical protein IJ680_04570 [Paludibacteraceae bacterium]|nr:hypothetical protein [Paludibacteraceae bacterium]
MHLKFVWADGLPYGPTRSALFKSALRSTSYKRVDIGMSRIFTARTDKFMRRPSARHISDWGVQLELFNLLNIKNVDSYYWVTDVYGQQYASPNYLTGFMVNLKLSVGFK